mmetsp:Transcript_22822/g.25647  ORF Transcript_22822/g.25647 Transcript_22822/m.25647 type:complete len:999 (-) Transcript_22822:117-3113(-)
MTTLEQSVHDDNEYEYEYEYEYECCAAELCEVASSRDYSKISTRNINNNINNNTTSDIIRILTWSDTKSELQKYADLYRSSNQEAPIIQFFDVPSLKELDYEVTSELKSESTLFDGFVVPPLFLGSMYQQRDGKGLAIWDEDEDEKTLIQPTSSSQQQQQNQQHSSYSLIDDLLPYYRYQVATFDDKIRSLPILSGSQTLLFFRKDYLDAKNLPTPKNWDDFTRTASALNQEPLGPNGEPIYGACLGLLSESGCRKRNNGFVSENSAAKCNSQSMTYLGMMLSSMTQVMGNSTGWMMGLNSNSPVGVDPLFQPTLEYIMEWMEQQIENGGPPNQLTEDSSYNMQLFRDGRCALTVTSDYDDELLKGDMVGFVPLPGSHYFLDRTQHNSNDQTNKNMISGMKNCTDTLCPYGRDYLENGGLVQNVVPFGAVDATVGAVSGFASNDHQEETKKFFKFVVASDLRITGDQLREVSSSSRFQQPLTYSELERSIVPGYETTMTVLTSSRNAAIPFRIPNAFSLLSELDDRVYEYLVDGDFDGDKRRQVAQTVVNSWQTMISMYDARDRSLPTSVFYEKSLGEYIPEPASDLYIGWVARGIMWSLGGISCLASIFLAIWVWKYQHERVIRASQPVFLWLICGGTLVMASSVFTSGIEDDIASYQVTSAACTATYWLYSLGFVGVITAMFSKIWMLGKVFEKPRNEQRLQITRQDILIPFFVNFGIDFLILFIWTIFDPQNWKRIPINEGQYSLNLVEKSTLGFCASDQTRIYLGVLVAYNFAIVVLSLVQSYECRRITTEYSESLWITASIATTAQAWIVSIPLVILLEDPRIYFIVRSSAILCTTLPVLLLIFAPKMIYLHEALGDKKEKHLSTKQRKEQNEKNDDTYIQAASASSSKKKATSNIEKGTIGIRIAQFAYLDSDEVDELEEAVDKAQQRNTILRNTLDRLTENLEERRYARNYHVDFHNQNNSVTGASGRCGNDSILAARPGNNTVRQDTYRE